VIWASTLYSLLHGCELFGGAFWMSSHAMWKWSQYVPTENLGTHQSAYTVLWPKTTVSKLVWFSECVLILVSTDQTVWHSRTLRCRCQGR
jgi:hypothetical protein